jgi:ATP-dependent protease ClpP protease subunit
MLLSSIDQMMQQGIRSVNLLLSSPGGTVFHGLSGYNYLKGIPAQVTTHNFGSVDSVGLVLFCAGSRRLSVPHARFLMHGVSTTLAKDQAFEEKQLEEILKGIRIDMLNIARVIASNTGKNEEDVKAAMLERTTLDPDQAKQWGLVHEIRSEVFEQGSKVIAIHQ